MNILHLLSQNLWSGSRTRIPDDNVPYPEGFRGEIEHEAALCIACGTCAYICSPGAITIIREEDSAEIWKYTEDRCTFCGRCVDFCPTQAIQFKQKAPGPISERTQHYISHEIETKPCKRCGEPVHIMPDALFDQYYRKQIMDEVTSIFDYCERCRQMLTAERVKEAIEDRRGDYDN